MSRRDLALALAIVVSFKHQEEQKCDECRGPSFHLPYPVRRSCIAARENVLSGLLRIRRLFRHAFIDAWRV
jgi:hypothetical protein